MAPSKLGVLPSNAMTDDLFLDAPNHDAMPTCEECGDELLPHERECCEACDRDYYARVVAWAKGAEDRDLSLVYDGVRPSIH